MKTHVRTTSIEAYRQLHNLGERQRQVLSLLSIRDMSNLELSKASGIAINAITPRTKELRELGLVEDKGRKICPYTGRSGTVWGRVKDLTEAKPMGLFEGIPSGGNHV